MKKRNKSGTARESTEYQRKKKRGLALASAYVDAELWARLGKLAEQWNNSALKKKYDGGWNRSDLLREALERFVDENLR